MPLQAALFDTAPLHAIGPRVTSKAEMFADACALVAPYIADGYSDEQIRRGSLDDGTLMAAYADGRGPLPPRIEIPRGAYRQGIGSTALTCSGQVECWRDQGKTYARFSLADIRAHLETIERTQERMF